MASNTKLLDDLVQQAKTARAAAVAAAKNAASEQKQKKNSNAVPQSFTRQLYELDYISTDFKALVERHNQLDKRKNPSHVLRRRHLMVFNSRVSAGFQFLQSIDGAGWSSSAAKSRESYEGWTLPEAPRANKSKKTPQQLDKVRKQWLKSLRPLEAMLNDSSLKEKTWFHGPLDRKQAEATLQGGQPGTYLVRISTSHKGVTLSVQSKKGAKHFMIHYMEGQGYFIYGQAQAFRHIDILIDYYNTHPLAAGSDLMLIFPASPLKDDFDSDPVSYVALVESTMDPDTLAVVRQLARERREAEQLAQDDPFVDGDPVLHHEELRQQQEDDQKRADAQQRTRSTKRRNWFRKAPEDDVPQSSMSALAAESTGSNTSSIYKRQMSEYEGVDDREAAPEEDVLPLALGIQELGLV